jgi:hypothetical protein
MHTTLKKARPGQLRRWRGGLAAIGLLAMADARWGLTGSRPVIEAGQVPTITTARGALMRRIRSLLSFIAATMVMLAGAGMAQAASNHATTGSAGTGQAAPASPNVTFASFQAATRQATYADYASRSQTGGVQNAQAFAQMQSYLANLYRGVQTVSSFEEEGNTFDCVTTMSQPTVQALHITRLAAPPVASSPPGGLAGDGLGAAATSPPEQGLTNGVGPGTSCPAGTIPMERVTLDAMTRFPNLHAFLSTGAAPSYSKGHLHAKGYQDVTNTGDNTTLNLWNPAGDFTLSQQWTVGGSGTGMQTVEGGWVHSTRMFGSDAVLFIYFTPDDYSTGCYNLDCTGFVQVDNTWTLGAGWSHYSTYGGTQYIFTMQWQYYQGNWWLLLKGGGGWTDVGYYPGSTYGSGPLASGNASRTTFGGEVCNGPSGGKCTDPNWPQMGSGNFASAGWQQAAYQHDLFYINSSGTSVWSSLTPVTESSKCYSTTFTPSSSGGSWGSYIYFGGPGGYMC